MLWKDRILLILALLPAAPLLLYAATHPITITLRHAVHNWPLLTLWLLVAAIAIYRTFVLSPSRDRRWLRHAHRAHTCERCGYPRTLQLPACPECGHGFPLTKNEKVRGGAEPNEPPKSPL